MTPRKEKTIKRCDCGRIAVKRKTASLCCEECDRIEQRMEDDDQQTRAAIIQETMSKVGRRLAV